MKIRIDDSEHGYTQFGGDDGEEFDVPDEMVRRWEVARDAWKVAEDEMWVFLKKSLDARIAATLEAKRIQEDADRIEVERLRRNALAGQPD